MPPEMTTDELVVDLHRRFGRVEQALMGDRSIGHVGLVTRVEALETQAANVARAYFVVLGSVVGGAALGGGSVWALLTG